MAPADDFAFKFPVAVAMASPLAPTAVAELRPRLIVAALSVPDA